MPGKKGNPKTVKVELYKAKCTIEVVFAVPIDEKPTIEHATRAARNEVSGNGFDYVSPIKLIKSIKGLPSKEWEEAIPWEFDRLGLQDETILTILDNNGKVLMKD